MKRIMPYLAVVAALSLALLSCRTLAGAPVISASPGITTNPTATSSIRTEIPTISQPPALDLIASQDTLVRLYEVVNPGVVSIQVLTQEGGAQGSGFVIDNEGHIVTNYHVVEEVDDLEVAFSSGFKARAEVIGMDLDSDLAVLKVEAPAEELHPLPLGDSDQVKVGQTVVAIGNPFGLQGTMTVGIISGLGRTVQSLHFTSDGSSFSAGDILQTDAAINPGNSGGPLLNLNGEVVGVSESIRTNNFSSVGQPLNSGVGFAISINIVKRVAPSLISAGKYDYPYLGIMSPQSSNLTLLAQEALGLARSTGVYITGVVPGGPADKAGLIAGTQDTSLPGLKAGGDLIIAIDGKPVVTFSDLIGYLVKSKNPGEKVILTILRGEEEKQVELTLDKRPDS